MIRWLHILVPLAILVVGIALRVGDPSPIQQLRLLAFDTYQRAKPRPYDPTTSPVVVVDIDDESLARLGQWPWPRTLLARLIERLAALGAATVALDMVFAEPDRTSPEQVIPLWPDSPELHALSRSLSGHVSHDAQFAEAIASVPAVLGVVLTEQPGERMPMAKAGFSHAGDDPRLFAPGFAGAVLNRPEIETAASGQGAFNVISDADNVVRRAPLVFRIGDRLYPSLLAEALRVAQGARSYLVKSSGASGETAFGAQTGINNVRIGRVIVPTDARGQVIIRYSHRAPGRTVPVWRVLEPDLDRARIEGRIVFVGTSAAGLQDLRATPLAVSVPGVEVHAQVVEQIVDGAFLARPDWATGAELAFLVAVGLLLIVISGALSALWAALFGAVAVFGAIVSSWLAFDWANLLLDPVYPTLTALLMYMAQTLITYLRTERERRQVRGAFGRYMSPELVEQLAKHPERLKLGGEMRNMTVMFCDIRGFTGISERLDANGLTRFINEFLTPMTDVILERRGTIDKYMGDCIMAFWNAPLDDPEHAMHACLAALDMCAELDELNAQWLRDAERRGESFDAVRFGIGLNTGTCCVGNMGSEQRFDYSVIGDDVNLASRLEGQCKNYGVDIVMGENTHERVKTLAVIELDLIRVIGKERPVRIYALLGDSAMADGDAYRKLTAEHGRLLDAYRAQDWDAADRAVESCVSADAGCDLGELYALYRERIRGYRMSPPGPAWDGVHVAELK